MAYERPEIILWRDAHFSLDDTEDGDDFIVTTIGWTREDGHFLRVESERLPDDRGARAVSRIPKAMIVQRMQLILDPEDPR